MDCTRDYCVKDISLAPEGEKKIDWVSRFMPVLQSIRKDFEKEKPFKGLKIATCLHLEMKTAFLLLTLKAGGAEVSATASNPLSTQDDVVAALAKNGVKVYAIRGENREEYYENMHKALDIKPNILIDDGADMVSTVLKERQELIENIWGASEETTTGVIRLRAMEKDGVLRFPIIAVNDSYTKYLFDNRYGTGQSTWDGILRSTNLLIAGKNVVVVGYGWCGRGIAMRAKGLGATVIVVEVDPIRALEARMDGFLVMSMNEAAKVGDIFVTSTGDINCIRREHFEVMKDGVIMANAGHFDVEISKPDLESLAVEINNPRPHITEYKLKDGRRLYLLAEGRLVNLAAADGHPAEIMDMSFALQAMAAKYIRDNHEKLENRVYVLPREIDEMVARIKLKAMGIEIEQLTEEQKKYLESWEHGT
ncbi:S-adenosyl-L-homocysteine hydrolase [Palaeococcus pacificus DY20341]|uniref:Adenosylhomocysteinase n=1 Tax=Palaeococcus pacificus DY20341 TaxID=1343739 RepID=A0A075LU39_9EURY|nr:adenosylhomocysteinase [Palaeococcus pacificus]AIF69477.1 S-adenosyl-L-homocysteine hydrolase [Palaeococcus pacificus DY20341]